MPSQVNAPSPFLNAVYWVSTATLSGLNPSSTYRRIHDSASTPASLPKSASLPSSA